MALRPAAPLRRPIRSLVPLLWLVPLGCAPARGGGGPSFEQLEASSIDASRATVLALLTSGRGSLIVFGSETDSLAVRYAVSSPTRAGLFRNQVETIDKDDSLLVAIRPTPGSTIDLQIEMPERLTVDLRDEGRDVIFRNVENRVDVFQHTSGSLNFDDIEGPLTISDGVGPIRIHDVRGPILISDQGGGIRIQDVKNTVHIEARGSGDLLIENVGGDVSVTAGAGRLTVRDVAGALRYRKTGPGEVAIERVSGAVERL